jgi:hypothetical protein
MDASMAEKSYSPVSSSCRRALQRACSFWMLALEGLSSSALVRSVLLSA